MEGQQEAKEAVKFIPESSGELRQLNYEHCVIYRGNEITLTHLPTTFFNPLPPGGSSPLPPGGSSPLPPGGLPHALALLAAHAKGDQYYHKSSNFTDYR